MPLTTVHIDLPALQHNLALVREIAPGRKVMAVIKANAYGHGMLECANALSQAEGFAVARFEEALLLRQHYPDHTILVMNPDNHPQHWQPYSEHRLTPVIHTESLANQLVSANIPAPIDAWLKIDTGMHRLGITPEQANPVFQRLADSSRVRRITWMTHLASADETHNPFTARQLEVFHHAIRGQTAETSIANSAGVLAWPDTHGTWVRPGIMLYGYDPLDAPNAWSQKLKPVMTLRSRVIAIRHINTGESVGYGNQWKADQPSCIASIACGYGDGYPRSAQHGTPVWINGHVVPLVGRVSMDLITADITGCNNIEVGDTVELWGKHLPINYVAQCANTISYELTTRLTARPVRTLES